LLGKWEVERKGRVYGIREMCPNGAPYNGMVVNR
jgi:hypothetical protein